MRCEICPRRCNAERTADESGRRLPHARGLSRRARDAAPLGRARAQRHERRGLHLLLRLQFGLRVLPERCASATRISARSLRPRVCARSWKASSRRARTASILSRPRTSRRGCSKRWISRFPSPLCGTAAATSAWKRSKRLRVRCRSICPTSNTPWSGPRATLSAAPDYFPVAAAAIDEMVRQVGAVSDWGRRA